MKLLSLEKNLTLTNMDVNERIVETG